MISTTVTRNTHNAINLTPKTTNTHNQFAACSIPEAACTNLTRRVHATKPTVHAVTFSVTSHACYGFVTLLRKCYEQFQIDNKVTKITQKDSYTHTHTCACAHMYIYLFTLYCYLYGAIRCKRIVSLKNSA